MKQRGKTPKLTLRFGCDAEIRMLSGARLTAGGPNRLRGGVIFPSAFKPLDAAKRSFAAAFETHRADI